MRRFNVLYVVIPLAIWGLFAIFRYLNRSTASFYGVAENRETQINLDYPVTVNRIHVTQGQFVVKGTLLLEVTRNDLDFKLSELTHSIAELQAQDRLNITEIRGELGRLRAERAEKTGEILSEIRVLESERSLNRSLFRDLKSLPPPDSATNDGSPYTARINALREELRLATEPFDAEIARLEQTLKIAGAPAQAQIGKLKKEIDLYHKEQARLKIYAPTDGLVGAVHCQPGVNVPDFDPLISFYEQTPNTVVAYVHESMILHIGVGDSLDVISSLHPSERCRGRVSGLGHRVVEIPERLRKIPEIKTYGREILVEIPTNNHFLQKEKVVLRRIATDTSSILSFFQSPFSSGT